MATCLTALSRVKPSTVSSTASNITLHMLTNVPEAFRPNNSLLHNGNTNFIFFSLIVITLSKSRCLRDPCEFFDTNKTPVLNTNI